LALHLTEVPQGYVPVEVPQEALPISLWLEWQLLEWQLLEWRLLEWRLLEWQLLEGRLLD
jgi:hypothetical protein